MGLPFFKRGVRRPGLDVPFSSSGIEQLTPLLAINGLSALPELRYKGGDANGSGWTAWGYGSNLSFVAGTSPTFYAGAPFLGSANDSVLFNAGGHFQAGAASVGNVTTEDLVVEVVFRASVAGATKQVIFKSDGTNGWQVEITSAGALRLVLTQNSSTVAVSAGTVVDGAWYHAMWFVNRDENSTSGAVGYLNATAGSGANPFALRASIGNSALLSLGANASAGEQYAGALALVSVWKQGGWHQPGSSGPTEWAAVAKERFARLCGVYPRYALGTRTPSVMIRASTAQLDILRNSVRTTYLVGAGWPRVCRRVDSDGTEVSGYLAEKQVTNFCLQSADLSTTWTKIDAGDGIVTNSWRAPSNDMVADAIVPDASNNQHGVTQDVTITGALHVYSCWMKAGTHSWGYLADATVANCTAYFNLATGVMGTLGSGVAAGFMEDWGNGWYRCGIRFTGTSAAHTFQISPADGNGDITTSGNGSSAAMYVWGVQLERSVDRMTSFIPTTTASATRQADRLDYKADDGSTSTTKGTLEMSVLVPEVDDITAAQSVLCIVNGPGSGNYNVHLSIGTSEVLDWEGKDGGVTQWDITDTTTEVADNLAHRLTASWNANLASLTVDGVSEGTADSSATVPSNMTLIRVGQNMGSTGQLGGLIGGLKIYREVVR